MNKVADLHLHTIFSDSTFSPVDIVREALAHRLACVAVTDHDTLDGVLPTQEAAHGFDLEILPGIELSCEWQEKDIHILAYLMDQGNERLTRQLARFREARVERIYKMVQKLQELGIRDITAEEVLRQAGSDSVGRPHLASLLVEKGVVHDMRTAFDRYLAEDRPAYVSKYKQTPFEAIELIHQAGGIAVLAHPVMTRVDELIAAFAEAGLDGLEVYYPHSTINIISHYEGIAAKHDMIMTGGSDAHGEDRSHAQIGYIQVPYELVEGMKKRAERYR